MTKQIVISRGYGAGWASWVGEEHAQAVAEYQPIVEYVAAGGPILSGKPRKLFGSEKTTPWEVREDWLHADFRPLVRQMMDELGLDHFYTGGADGLTVETVNGPYRIDEYDGYESITTTSDLWGVTT